MSKKAGIKLAIATDDIIARQQQQECDTFLPPICVTFTVPEGFFIPEDIDYLETFPSWLGASMDFSGLTCIFTPREVRAIVRNPCSPHGTIPCTATLFGANLVGCVRGVFNIRNLQTINRNPDYTSTLNAALCAEATSCVNQIIGYTCNDTCEDCFILDDIYVTLPTFGEDLCGRQTVSLTFLPTVIFTGCMDDQDC